MTESVLLRLEVSLSEITVPLSMIISLSDAVVPLDDEEELDAVTTVTLVI